MASSDMVIRSARLGFVHNEKSKRPGELGLGLSIRTTTAAAAAAPSAMVSFDFHTTADVVVAL